ncbi:hypothetical protein [Nibricoccus sp. IMCC34717]|uniref:hypothetical protein n=1 Tax=Nibricoccus sp. IMCC34717 TaxID=3034021 RepID=UPI00384D972F
MSEVESESLRLLRQLIEGSAADAAAARKQAEVYLRTLRRVSRPENRPPGRPSRYTDEQLREVSRLAGEGLGYYKIECLTGVDRGAVFYHLMPSKRMMRAMLGQGGSKR